ncbi:MAG: OprD family outer membrane porin [Desulfopila sp.]
MKLPATIATTCAGLLLTCSMVSAAETLAEVFTEGTVRGELRYLYFDRDFDGKTKDWADSAAGTLLYYNTAELFGLSAGVGYASSNDIGSDDDKNVYGLLARNSNGSHDSYSRFQEYFLQGNWFDTKIKIGAQEIETPFLQRHDIRMTPKTYRGLTIENNSIENLTLQALYITDYMSWNDDDFQNMDSISAEKGADDNPLFAGSLKYTLPFESSILTTELWHYYMEDYFKWNYARVNFMKDVGEIRLQITPSFLSQKSDGKDYIGHLDSTQYGFSTGARAYGFDLTLFYTRTDDDPVFAPWGDSKVMIQQILASGRADENAYGARLIYDFGRLGIDGLSTYIFYGYYDVDHDSKTYADVNETDFNIQYNFSGFLKGFSVRGRYAIVDYDGGTADDLNDFRIYLRYAFSFGGNKDA